MKKRHLATTLGLVSLIIMLFITFTAACAQAPAETVTWRLHTEDPAGDVEVNAYQVLSQAVLQDSDGTLKIEIYPGSSLGYERGQVLSLLEDGSLEMAVVSAGWMSGTEPILGVGELPFLLANSEDKPKMMDICIPYWQKTLNKHGVSLLASWSNPPTNLLVSKPVTKVEEWKGVKGRSWSPTISAIYEALGAIPVSLDKSEAYSAMQTGVIDGSIYSTAGIIEQKFYEVVKHLSLWGVSPGVSKILVVNSAKYDALPKKTQDAIQKHIPELQKVCWDGAYWVEEDAKAEIESYGVTIHQVPAEEIAKAAQMTKDAWLIYLDKTGAEGLELLNAILEGTGQEAYK